MDATSCICSLILPLARMSYPQFDVWSVKEGNALAGGAGADDMALWVETEVKNTRLPHKRPECQP